MAQTSRSSPAIGGAVPTQSSAVGKGLIRLEEGPDDGEWRLDGKWGLSWDGGSGMIGDIVEYGGDFLVRRFTMADGDPPRSAPAFVSGDVYPNDPYLAFGIKYEEVEYETPLGRQDAWRFEGDDDNGRAWLRSRFRPHQPHASAHR